LNDFQQKGEDDRLLPSLQRQSRYWIPLLLNWLKGEIGNNEDTTDHDTIASITASANKNLNELPLKTKQRRQQRQKSAQLSSSIISAEVQIEALRALTALSEWTSRVGGVGIPLTTTMMNEEEEDAFDRVHKKYTTSQLLTAGCTPQNPLSPSSQRILLRQPDAVPMIVSLLSSPDAAVHEQAMWILGSIASSGLGATTLPTPPPQAAVARAAAAEVTKMMSEHSSGSSSSSGLDGSMSVAIPTAAMSSSSEMVGAAGNDAVVDIISPVPPRSGSSSSSSSKDKSSISARDVIFAAGAMDSILKCLADNPRNVPLHRAGAWCLSNLVEGRYSSSSSTNEKATSSSTLIRKPVAIEEMDIYTLLPTVKRMLHMDDTEVLTHTCWTLSHFCDGPAYHIAAVIYYNEDRNPKKLSTENGLVPRLVELLLHPSPKVAKPALRTVGNIVCADSSDQQDQNNGTIRPVVDFTEIILEWNAVACLRQLVEHPNREIQKEACWTLSNIAAGTASQIQAVIDSGAIRPLVDIVNNDRTDKEVRSEACWVVLNATSCGSDDQISTLIEEGCVSVLGVLLTEPNMVMMALEGVERVLQTEEAQDSVDLGSKSEEELGQRPTILKCASLIKAVTESPHNSSVVSKRAKYIWEQHFVSCALCHNNYSRCRILNSHFCNECKCHVCSKCDCRVYHLSYQEELWAEDEQKAAESKNQKKSKKQKKKQKMKEKAAEKKKIDVQVISQPPSQGFGPAKVVAAAAASKGNDSPTNTSKANNNASADSTIRKTSSSPSPSRGTIESDGASVGVADDNTGDNAAGGIAVNDSCDTNNRQPPIDLVLYLQETGSIIALAKLMDSLYDHEFDDEDDERDGRQQQKKKTMDLNHRVLTTQ
jgi:hypothetical protein